MQDPGLAWEKDGSITLDVPPDEFDAPAPDHRWLGFAYVNRHDVAGIWVAFFSRCQRYRC